MSLTTTKTKAEDATLIAELSKALEQEQAAIRGGGLKLAAPEVWKARMPIQLQAEAAQRIRKQRRKIQAILAGDDPARMIIVGPCSPDFRGLDDGKVPAVLSFARQLKTTIDEVERQHDVVVIVRAPVVKPRTSVGWGGIFTDSPTATRLLFTALANEGIAIATEVYGQHQEDYLADLCVLTWTGARNVLAPNTRNEMADATMPVLVKHSLSDIISAVNARAVMAAEQPVSRIDWESGQLTMHLSAGNPHTLTILRGYEQNGHHHSNIDSQSVLEAARLAASAGLHAGVVIDISHSNGNKSIKGTLQAFEAVLKLLGMTSAQTHIKGIMAEAYLGEKGDNYGQSATDPTLNIDSVRQLIHRFADAHSKSRRVTR